MSKYIKFLGQLLIAISILFIVYKMGPILIAFLIFVAGSVLYFFARKHINANNS
jgi:hypothetical protein